VFEQFTSSITFVISQFVKHNIEISSRIKKLL